MAERKLVFRTAKEIATRTPDSVPWLVQPWVAAGAITQVVGKPKTAGKTTWVLHMVRAVLDGVDFMGSRTRKTPVVVLTEERETTFREALRRSGLLDRDDLIVLQWRHTLGVPWEDIVAEAALECERRPCERGWAGDVSGYVVWPCG